MRFIDELEGLASNQLNVIKTCLTMTKLEATLAGLSVYPLLINLCMLFASLISTWIMAMGLICYALTQVLDSVVMAVLTVFLFNTICVGIFVRHSLNNLKKMSFEKTRAYLNARKMR